MSRGDASRHFDVCTESDAPRIAPGGERSEQLRTRRAVAHAGRRRFCRRGARPQRDAARLREPPPQEQEPGHLFCFTWAAALCLPLVYTSASVLVDKQGAALCSFWTSTAVRFNAGRYSLQLEQPCVPGTAVGVHNQRQKLDLQLGASGFLVLTTSILTFRRLSRRRTRENDLRRGPVGTSRQRAGNAHRKEERNSASLYQFFVLCSSEASVC